VADDLSGIVDWSGGRRGDLVGLYLYFYHQ
jgi:hypothetical protein